MKNVKGFTIGFPIAILIMVFLVSLAGCKGVQPTLQTTVTIHHDTIFTKEIHKDTILNNIYSKDTVFIRENKMTIKYLYKGDSSAYIGGTIGRDTVVKVDTTIVVQKTVIKLQDKPLSGWDNFCRWLVGIGLAGALIYAGIKNLPAIIKILKGGL